MELYLEEIPMVKNFLRSVLSPDNLRRDLRTAAVALVVSAAVVATPSVAQRVVNADKVDGRHAVGAGASVNARKGKLVATSRRGFLPDNIIRSAPNAHRLGGAAAGAYQTRVARPGEVLHGEFGAWGGSAGGYVEDTVAFGKLLPVAIPLNRITVLDSGDPFTAECPAVGQVVPRGWVCVYTNTQSGVTNLNSYNATSGNDDTSRVGFGLWGDCSGPSCLQYGSWVARAGSSADVSPRPTSRSRASNP